MLETRQLDVGAGIPGTVFRKFYPGVSAEHQARFETHLGRLAEIHRNFEGGFSEEAWASIAGFFAAGGDITKLHPDIAPEVKEAVGNYKKGIAHVEQWLAQEEPTLQSVAERISRADALSGGSTDMVYRAAMRLAAFMPAEDESDLTPSHQLLSDADGSVTTNGHREPGSVEDMLPGARYADPYEAGHIAHANITRPATALFRRRFLNDPECEPIYREAGQLFPLRDGMHEVFSSHYARGGYTWVASTNAVPALEEMFHRRLGVPNARIIGIAGDHHYGGEGLYYGSLAFEKHLIAQGAAVTHPNKLIFVLVDGETDTPLLDPRATRVIGGHFVYSGSPMARKLRDACREDPNLIYFDFDNGHDIKRTLTQIETLAIELRRHYGPILRGETTIGALAA